MEETHERQYANTLTVLPAVPRGTRDHLLEGPRAAGRHQPDLLVPYSQLTEEEARRWSAWKRGCELKQTAAPLAGPRSDQGRAVLQAGGAAQCACTRSLTLVGGRGWLGKVRRELGRRASIEAWVGTWGEAGGEPSVSVFET